jgi:diguanylate cyclase (GGDEF)-like protein/PAS domain S-box-containing protein
MNAKQPQAERRRPESEGDDSPLIYLSTEFIRAKEYLEAILSSTSDAIWTTDLSGRVIFFSPGAEKMLDLPAREAFGRHCSDLLDGGREEAQGIHRHLFARGSLAEHETVLLGAGGRRVHASMSASLLKDRDGNFIGMLAVSKDIGRRVELESRLRELSITDELTGLHNQRHFQQRGSEEVLRARRQRQKLSLVVLDIDDFKKANDLLGHVEGDRILREVADLVRESIRAGVDLAFRYGGDEFVVLLPGMGERLARRVAARISQASDRKGRARLSAGTATLRQDESLTDLLRRADLRMFGCKRAKPRLSAASP